MPFKGVRIDVEFDESKFNGFINALEAMGDERLAVGIADVDHPRTGAPMDQVFLWLEYGTSSQPPRPFATPELRKNEARYAKRYLNRVVRGALFGDMSAEGEALYDLGTQIEADLKNRLIRMRSPANAPSTIRKKGGRSPGIETGTLVESITFVVERA